MSDEAEINKVLDSAAGNTLVTAQYIADAEVLILKFPLKTLYFDAQITEVNVSGVN